ncbi:polyprenyl diphosphate synthase [Streptomyces sp. NPDC088560]|uniref:polyprenyl diphosphate synthase n=1 Tax=Streptomyces sp. NPDC088560 TaxID=3365868 RepID=UPI0037F749D4
MSGLLRNPSIEEPDDLYGLVRHIGIVMDGNRRWAEKSGLSLGAAYRAGARRIPPLLDACGRLGVEVVTLWALAQENLQRASGTIEDLMAIISSGLSDMASTRRWRLRIIGDLRLLPPDKACALRRIEESTRQVSGLVVNVAIAHSGRAEIIEAVRSLMADQAAGIGPRWDSPRLEAEFTERLSTAGQPDLDLIVRTSGEQRTSGFLLWQAAQSELVFSRKDWPEFGEDDLLNAMRQFALRRRTFGR